MSRIRQYNDWIKSRRKLRHLIITLLLILALAIYVVATSYIFTAYERGPEEARNARIVQASTAFDELCDNYSLQKCLEYFPDGAYCNASSKFVVDLTNFCNKIGAFLITKTTNHWTRGGSIFFVLTIVTTIGYGVTAPTTTAGQAWCVAVAIVGIPLAAVTFGMIGKMIGYPFSAIWDKLVLVKLPRAKSFQKIAMGTALMTAVLALLTLFALPISLFESWTYWEGFYFSFITVSTIGFGDFAPSTTGGYYFTSFFLVLTCIGILVAAFEFLTAFSADDARDIHHDLFHQGDKNHHDGSTGTALSEQDAEKSSEDTRGARAGSEPAIEKPRSATDTLPDGAMAAILASLNANYDPASGPIGNSGFFVTYPNSYGPPASPP